jgi:hypothetical protein
MLVRLSIWGISPLPVADAVLLGFSHLNTGYQIVVLFTSQFLYVSLMFPGNYDLKECLFCTSIMRQNLNLPNLGFCSLECALIYGFSPELVLEVSSSILQQR